MQKQRRGAAAPHRKCCSTYVTSTKEETNSEMKRCLTQGTTVPLPKKTTQETESRRGITTHQALLRQSGRNAAHSATHQELHR